MWPAFSKIPDRETSIPLLYPPSDWYIQSLSEGNLSIFVPLKLNDLIVCLFIVRHLGECWSHDSPFCVNVTLAHIFGNVQPKKSNVHANTNTFKHKHIFSNTNTRFLQRIHKFVWNSITTTFKYDLTYWLTLFTGETIQNAAGFGLHYVDGKAQWDLTTNVNIRKLEASVTSITVTIFYIGILLLLNYTWSIPCFAQ